jgi:hypothetical protein
MNPPPVWAPIKDVPHAFVPVARHGMRTWDINGPQQ